MVATTINVLNEKQLKYKVSSKDGMISMIFGILTQGVTKNKVEIIPCESEILVKIFETERKFADEKAFGGFIDTILELKAIQEKETALIEELKKAV